MVSVFTDYPGGNATDVSVRGDTVRLEQAVRDSTEWWFYWNVGVESDRARELTLEFTNGGVVGRPGPAVSHDRECWEWLGADSTPDRQQFTYDLDAGERVYFAFSLPYQVSRFEQFVDGVDALDTSTLTTSEGGREVPIVELGNPDAGGAIVLTCRHHACESVASYVLEGVLRELAASKPGILSTHRVLAVPFVDVDGVERGDQGKNRAPHDHNRDYVFDGNALSEDIDPIYRSTAAVMDRVESMDARLSVALDLHCPWKWADEPGGRGDRTHLLRPEGPTGDRVARFSERLGEVTSGGGVEHDPMKDAHAATVEWSQPRSPTAVRFFGARGADLAATLEYPYFGTEEHRVTQGSSRGFGRDLAVALGDHLLND